MTGSRALSLSLGIVVALALSFALFTSHVWEDYYITYRSSKHLATGNGLVYNLGDKLHTFTSPLGVLLPAAASLITGNTSDTGALWIFRLMCSLALGGAAICLIQIGHGLRYSSLVIFFLTAWFVTDVKTLDFTINRMETGFLLFFLAYTIRAHLANQTLNPTAVTSDRGLKQFQITLPAHESEATLLLRIYPGKNTDRDWTCWGYPEFK